MPIPQPSATCGIKLASLAAHVKEFLNTDQRSQPFDLTVIEVLLLDPEVAAYLAELEPLGLLPVPR